MSIPIPCGICGLMMDYVYDKRVKYCTPTCARIAKKNTSTEFYMKNNKDREHLCKYCLKPIECCGSRQRKYHPECQSLIHKEKVRNGVYAKRKQRELKEYSLLNKRLKGKYKKGGSCITDTAYDGFSIQKKDSSEEKLFTSDFSLTPEQIAGLDVICQDIERLCLC